MIRLHFSNSLPRGVKAGSLRQAAKTAYKYSGFKTNLTANLAFVTRARSKRLNNQYAGLNQETDVLSFVYGAALADIQKPQETADIAICTSLAKQQAKAHGQPLAAEASLLLVHGIWHVLGFDHHSAVARTSFEQNQNAIMNELKIRPIEYLNG